MPYTLDQIADAVYRLESSSGKNDKCVRKGLGYNGYGWGQSLTKDNCHPNRQAVREKVIGWFDRNLETMTLAEALCYYNQGKPGGVLQEDCKYYRDFKEIIE